MRAAAAFIASVLLSAVLLPAVLLSATPPSNPLPGPAGVSYGTIATYFLSLTGGTVTGQIADTLNPTNTSFSNGAIIANPAACGTDEILVGAGVAGTGKATLDCEGDIVGVKGTFSGLLTSSVTSQASTAETMFTATVSDDTTAGIGFINGSSTNSQLQPFITAFQDTSNAAATAWRAATTAALDTGTTPLMLLQGGLTTAYNGALSAVSTRPLFGWYNAGTEVLEMSANGALTETMVSQSSTTETLHRWKLSDDASSFFTVENTTSTDSRFVPTLKGFSSFAGDSYGLVLKGLVSQDTGTQAALQIQVGTGNASGVLNGGLSTKPAFDILNNATNIFDITATGGLNNPSSNTCGASNVVGAGSVCLQDEVSIAPLSGSGINTVIYMRASANTLSDTINFYDATATLAGWAGFSDASVADADIANKIYLYGSKLLGAIRSDDVAAGTIAWEVRDNAAATGVQLAGVYGDGKMKHGTAQMLTHAYLGKAGATLPVIADGIWMEVTLDQAFTLTKAKGRLKTAGTGAGNYVATATDGTNTCTWTIACTTAAATINTTLVNGAGTGCVYASGAAVTVSSTTDCTTPPQFADVSFWGNPQ